MCGVMMMEKEEAVEEEEEEVVVLVVVVVVVKVWVKLERERIVEEDVKVMCGRVER
jgi:hypothetical protein